MPALLVKLSAPYWFRLVPYAARALACAALMVASFLFIALAHARRLQLIGIALVAVQSGLGEASTLALGGAYETHRSLLTAWSSGTGFSGIFGYSWVILFHTIGGKSLRVTLLSALSFPILWVIAQFIVLTPPPSVSTTARAAGERAIVVASSMNRGTGDVALASLKESVRSRTDGSARTQPAAAVDDAAAAEGSVLLVPRTSVESKDSVPATPTAAQRDCESAADDNYPPMPVGFAATFRHVMSLWRYTVPLLVVYFAEYVCQAGVWASVGFPSPLDVKARDRFYKAANWCYQAGVFVSRSSGTLIQVSLPWLWAMPTLQIVLLAFFSTVAAVGPGSPIYGWWLLAPALVVGFMGGGTYVNAFTLLAAASPPTTRELSLGAASVADSIGIALADAAAVLVQGCLFRKHGVPGAEFACGAPR